jgi:Orange carotenoid protein, N-terminal
MSQVVEEKISQLQSLSSDDQLAVLWFLYKDLVKDKITPEAEREDENLEQANSLIDSIKAMSKEDQLQVQKDILAGSEREEFSTYKSYSSNQKLFFWYQLAAEMEQGSVVEFPSDYQLSNEGQELVKSLKIIDFSQQLTFMRDAVGYSTDDNLSLNSNN